MAKAPKRAKVERVKKVREVKLDPAKDQKQERRRVKQIGKDADAHPMERAAAIAVLGAAALDDPD